MRQVRGPEGVPEALWMRNGLVADAGAREPLDEEVGELGVLGVGAHHVAGAGRLRRAAHEFAVARRRGIRQASCLPLTTLLGLETPKRTMDGRHRRVREPARPVRGYIRRAPTLDVRRHVLDDRGEVPDRLDPVGRGDARVHVLVEQKTRQVDGEVAMREVDRAIAETPREALDELDAPARVALLRVEECRQLHPLSDRGGAAESLPNLAWYSARPAGARRGPCAPRGSGGRRR